MDESLITPELEARVGVASAAVEVEVTPLLVRRLYEMLGTLPADRGDAPPAVLVMQDAGREVSPLPGLPADSLVTGDEWEMRRPIRIGETLTAVNRLADLSERFGGRLGHTLAVRHQWEFLDTGGETVAVARRSMAYYEREGLRPREDVPAEFRPPAPPLDPVTGPAPWEARVGDPVTSRLLTPTLDQVVRYCAATWNITSIFFDPDVARANGLPGTIIPGPLKLALLAETVLAWAGPGALLESIRVAHRRPDVPRRPILLGGSVTEVEATEAGRRLHCEVSIQNANGERSSVGAATILIGS